MSWLTGHVLRGASLAGPNHQLVESTAPHSGRAWWDATQSIGEGVLECLDGAKPKDRVHAHVDPSKPQVRTRSSR